jgi:tRNA pseudouridine55 synthase
MDGILLVDKPVGWTSHDAVAKVRSIIKTETGQKVKVGHTGTLDPMATGLLILVLGKYTKKAAEFSKLDKTYQAELTLGKTSSTGDSEGEIVEKSRVRP